VFILCLSRHPPESCLFCVCPDIPLSRPFTETQCCIMSPATRFVFWSCYQKEDDSTLTLNHQLHGTELLLWSL
jgi:hypothetical protein